MEQLKRDRIIWDFLLDKFGNRYGAAALMGNLYAESKLVPNKLEYKYHDELKVDSNEYTRAVDSGDYKDRKVRSYSYPLPEMWELTLDTDVWVVGTAGKNVLGVWGGYDDNRRLPLKKEYYTYPKTIWKKIALQTMKRIS